MGTTDFESKASGSTSVNVTVSDSSSVASFSSSSSALAVNVLTWSGPPKSPLMVALWVNSQKALPARTVPTWQSRHR